MSEVTEDDPEFLATNGPDPVVGPSKPRLLGVLGPGLITGASDDDPSGIATYSQAGAQVGFDLLWLMPFTYPLMAVTQEISARLGRTTGRGLAGNIAARLARPIPVPGIDSGPSYCLIARLVINLARTRRP
jgi:hypothetical protein